MRLFAAAVALASPRHARTRCARARASPANAGRLATPPRERRPHGTDPGNPPGARFERVLLSISVAFE